MVMHRVTDKGSNAPENIERAVEVIGRSRVRRAVFAAVHHGRKQAKTVDELARETGEGRQQVLNAATQLSHQGLIHAERCERTNVYRRDPFYQANRSRILGFVDNPEKLKQLPTKRRPAGSATRIISVPVVRKKIKAKYLTVDEIQSFAKVRRQKPGSLVNLSEAATKRALLRIIDERGRFRDWGGEQNDFLTDRLVVAGKRRSAAFALKGPGKKGLLTPGKMGKNGDQIQRLARSPAEVLVVQYHGQVADSVREQLELFAQLKSVWEERTISYCIIDGNDLSRLAAAYPKEFRQ